MLCIRSYPGPPEDYNLRIIPDMMQRFGLVIGLSDYNTTAITSVAMGASIIEKHFPLDSFSLEPAEPAEPAALCHGAHTAWASLGKVDYRRKASEQGNVKFRRSLYFVKALKAGEPITFDAVRSVRPGFGLAPKYIDMVLGLSVNRDVLIGMPVYWELLG